MSRETVISAATAAEQMERVSCAECGADARVCRHLVAKHGLAGCCGACATGDTHRPADIAEVRT